MSDDRRFTFAPLERRGVFAGLDGGQLVTIAIGLVGGVSLLRSRPTAIGLVGALAAAAAGAACALIDVAGRPCVAWVPITSRHAWLRARGRHRTRPHAPRVGNAPVRAPLALAGLSFADIDGPAGVVGVVTDRRGGTSSGVLEAAGRSFSLLDSADQGLALDAWSSVLTAVARDGGAVVRLQWVQTNTDGDIEGLLHHFSQRPAAPVASAVTSYGELLAEAGTKARATSCYVAVAVRGRSPSLLLRELRLLEGQLRHAGVEVRGALSSRALCGLIRTACDPASRGVLAARTGDRPDWAGSAVQAAWPAATETHWDAYRTDRAWHATFWVAEWPRTGVAPGFLSPLLLDGSVNRRVSVVMAPASVAKGFREAEASRTAVIADEELRRRAGFLATARRRRELDGLVRREAELADGHVAYRFCGYVTVSASSRDELEDACSQTLHLAHRCRLDLRRLSGFQDVAFAWTLPLAGGLG